jgi:hypothetical protein
MIKREDWAVRCLVGPVLLGQSGNFAARVRMLRCVLLFTSKNARTLLRDLKIYNF